MLQGEKETEKMIVEAYAALLAFLSTERFVMDMCSDIFLIKFVGGLPLSVRAYVMPLPIVSRITDWQFLYLCWRVSYFFFFENNPTGVFG